MAVATKRKRRSGECKQITAGAKCPGKYTVTYDENIPIFTCEVCGDKDLTWNKFYKEYLELYKGRENWDDKRHGVSCVLGFFCHMYKETYQTDYTFVPRGPNPYNSKEGVDARNLIGVFSGDANRVRKYIYWLFKNCINKNTNITSFGYIVTPALINKYNLYSQKKDILSRESKLPVDFISLCRANYSSIFDKYALETMNDLGALLSYVLFYDKDSSFIIERSVLDAARKYNLIKGEKLNLGEHLKCAN